MQIDSNTKVVILTGAGISAESGLKTFRDADGLWENHAIEDVATPYAWERDPNLVWRFYQARRNQLLEVEPNPAHQALVRLEEFLGENFLLVTQMSMICTLERGQKTSYTCTENYASYGVKFVIKPLT